MSHERRAVENNGQGKEVGKSTRKFVEEDQDLVRWTAGPCSVLLRLLASFSTINSFRKTGVHGKS